MIIGDIDNIDNICGTKLNRDRQNILPSIEKECGRKQISPAILSIVPRWATEEPCYHEMEEN